MILFGGFPIDVFVKLSSVLLRSIEKKSPGSLGKHAMWILVSDLNYLFIIVIVQLKQWSREYDLKSPANPLRSR